MRDAVDKHEGHQAGVMNLHSGDGEVHDKLPPVRIHRGRVGQHLEDSFHNTQRFLALVGVKPNPLFAIGRVVTFQNSVKF